MKVYRIQCSECSYGPYSHASKPEDTCLGNYNSFEIEEVLYLVNKISQNHACHVQYPAATEDFDIQINKLKHYKCGFDSLKKLYKWFDGYIVSLKNQGFEIVEIEAEVVLPSKSGKQILYKGEKNVSFR